MTEQKIIAQKRADYFMLTAATLLIAACAVFMIVMFFTDDQPDAYIYLIIAVVFTALTFIPFAFLIRDKRLPDTLIYSEDGVLRFYNGSSCRAEQIRDVKISYNYRQHGAAGSGTLTLYTDVGKIVCRRIKNLNFAAANILTLKYGKAYSTDELKTAMSRRAADLRES